MNLSLTCLRAGALALLGGGSLILASPVLAQVAAPSSGASTEAQGLAPVDPERLALARQLFTTMRLDSSMRGMMASVFRSMPLRSAAGDAQANAKTQQLMTSFSAGFDANFPELIDEMAQLYARELTTQELRDSLAFYNTPSGQAILSKMPALMQQMAPLTMKLMPKIAAATEQDYCSRETCGEAEHALFKRMATIYSGGGRPAAPGA